MIDETKLYRVTYKDENGSGSFLAVHVAYKNGFLSCWDTNRHRLFQGEILKETKNGFTLRQDHDNCLPCDMEFKVLTLKEYDELVRPNVIDPPDFRSDAEMHEFYRRYF